MRQVDPIALAKAILWEEAKGKLRALWAAAGAEQSGRSDPPYVPIKDAIEEFIKAFEDEGHHE